jgi:hypothetical protein
MSKLTDRRDTRVVVAELFCSARLAVGQFPGRIALVSLVSV